MHNVALSRDCRTNSAQHGLTDAVRFWHIAIMLIAIPDPHTDRIPILKLMLAEKRECYFAHNDPGGLSDAQKKAWDFEHFALQLLLQAAQTRLAGEEELAQLLNTEDAA